MEQNKEIKLRYKFDKVISKPIEAIITNCDKLKSKVEPDYRIKISEQYIRFSIGMLRREKHSPNLKITLEKISYPLLCIFPIPTVLLVLTLMSLDTCK